MLFHNLSPRIGDTVVIRCVLALLAVLIVTAIAYAADKFIDARQDALIEDLKTNCADGPQSLVDRLRQAQTQFAIITPPGLDHPLHQPFGTLAFDPRAFPEGFIKGLVYDLEADCPVYTLTVQEDPKTRQIHFYNGEDVHIYTLDPDKDYDSRWLAWLLRPGIYDAKTPAQERTEIEDWLDPARVEIELKLIPSDYIETYAANTIATLSGALQSLGARSSGGGMMLMRLPAADSNIVFQAITRVTNGMSLEIGYPTDFTNRLDIFASTDLIASVWTLAATNLLTAGTNTIWWTDTDTNHAIRFYAAGNADVDNDLDGLTDAREKYLYHTSMTNNDSDGDGLVDGYSAVVSTNAYPGGAHTNGGAYVEGELTWATGAMTVDTDDDGMGDGWEVANGHNPTNQNDPPSVAGTVLYAGRQTGTVWVVAVTASNSWATNDLARLTNFPAGAAFRIPHLEQTNYWLNAWLDGDGNGVTNAAEARGTATNAALAIANRVTGRDITLYDPDSDSDGLPDWWELARFGGLTNAAAGDPDGDAYTNGEEYDADTDPGNAASHPWNLSGSVTYAGPQTGSIWVVACTESGAWTWTRAVTNAQPGAYTITHLPPDSNYWVRAWCDTDGDGQPPSTGNPAGSWEAWGSHSGNPVLLDTNVTGVDLALADPDEDADGLPDWWEVRYGLDPAHGGAEGASAWWKLDETTGTNAADAVSTNTGTLYGLAATNWVQGAIGNALAFNGGTGYVAVADSVDLKPTRLGLALWLTPSVTYSNGLTATFLGKEVGSKGYSLGYTNGALTFRFQSGGLCPVSWPCVLTSGVPVHIAATYDGAWQRLYVDAAPRAETNYNWGTGFGNISQGTNALRLGAAAGTVAGDFLTGTLDDVRLCGAAWTTNQIHGIWELGADPDGDGLGNAEEYAAGTDPGNPDTDGDGIRDGWEVHHGLSPLTADALEDPDGDGYLNIYECTHGSDPLSAGSVPAPTHEVTNGVATIQAVINSVTQDYAVVRVKAGTYTGSGNRDIDFGGRKLVLVGEGDSTNTVIDCQYAGRGFYFHGGETILSSVKGLTVTKGQAAWGAGIWVSGSSPWINGCVIVSNRPPVESAVSGGLALSNSSARITASRIEGNGEGEYGVLVDHGGGVAAWGGNLSFSNCVIRGNKALLNGGGLWFDHATGTLANCEISSNAAVYLEGGGLWATGTLSLANCTVVDNTAAQGGGGMRCRGKAVITGGEISGNESGGVGGGGLYLSAGFGQECVLDGVHIRDNAAHGSSTIYGGGGIALYEQATQALVRIANCVITGNTAEPAGGGILVSMGALAGIADTLLSNNTASVRGGGLAWLGEIPATVTVSRIVNNRAADGGGVALESADLFLEGTTVADNVAGANGGGCAVGYYAMARLKGGVITGNRADGGGGVAVASVAAVTLENVLVKGNQADSDGGGILADSVAPFTLKSCAVVDNTAGGKGGGINCATGMLQNTVLAGNVAGGQGGGLHSMAVGGVAIQLRNAVVWGNGGTEITGEWEPYIASGVKAVYSCIQGGYTNNGSSNVISADPQLVDGYRLLHANSPCLRAGTTNGLPATDINGESWQTPLTPDIGCDGFGFTDADSDGMNDEWETRYFGSLTNNGTGDQDNDGLADSGEYAHGGSPVDRDTDGDLMPDAYEVARGMKPGDASDAGGDWNGDGIVNSNEYLRGAFAVRVTLADSDVNDDSWNLLLNGSVIVSCNAGNTWSNSQVVAIEQGTTARFTLERPETGQWGGSDEYLVRFEPVDWPTNQAPWIASPDNAPLSASLPWNGEQPPDVSGIFWEFLIPSNMLQSKVDAGEPVSLTTEPINTINGAVTLDEAGLGVACPAFDLVFGLSYNSQVTATNGPLGAGWRHTLDWSLATATNAAYGDRAGDFKVLRTGGGAEYWFLAQTNGAYLPPRDVNLGLSWTNGEFRVTWPGGTVARFDADGALARLADGFGMGLTFSNAAGRLVAVTHDNGKALTLSYTGDRLTRVDSPSTNLYLTFAYGGNGMLTNATRVADGVPYPTRYDYEGVCHVLTQKVNTAGDIFAYGVGYVTNLPATTSMPAVVAARGVDMSLNPATADWYGHALDYTNPGGYATRVTYRRGDADVAHDYAYDPVHRWITQVTGPGSPGMAAWSNTWTRYSRDADGNVTNAAVGDPSGETAGAVAFYDSRHNVLSNGVSYCGNAATNWTRYGWNADDTLASVTDPAGRVTAFEYTNGLVSVIRECTNGAAGFETRLSYTTNGLLASVTNANGHGTGYEYEDGYLSRVVPALGPDARFVRDGLGRVTAVIVPGAAGDRTNALTLNALGQVTAATRPDGLTERFAFDVLGNLTNMVDTAGRTNVLTWHPTGKPASVSRRLDGASPTNVTISFAYDKQFNTLSITDPMGRAVERYALDMQDRPVAVTNLEGQAMTLNWGVGNYLKNLRRFDGTGVTNYYGTDGRLSWTMHPGKMSYFTWAKFGALAAVSGYTNNGASWSYDGSQITNGFDLLGRRTLEWSVFGGRTNAVAWQFDPLGNVTDMAVSNTGVRYGWTYDEAERPLMLTVQWASNRTSAFGWLYDTNNGLAASVTNAAIDESLAYDVLDRATNIAWTAGGTTVRSFGYAFNAAGMITNVAREDGGWTVYAYDSLDRLTSEVQYAATGLVSLASWTYDLAGNRTMAVTNGVTNLYLYAAGNLLTNFGSGTLVQHDLAGNITNLQYGASRKLGLKWNGRYELTEVRTNGVLAEKYDYDPLGRRVRIITGTVTNALVYDGPHVVAEYSNGVLARAYAYGPGFDDIRAMTTYGATTNTYFYLKDHLGSVHALVDTNGAVVEQYRYTAWGETTVLSSNGTVLAASAYGNRVTFQGREVSYATGLYHFRSRYYAPTIGRWLSKDRIGISGGHNLFEAFRNAPTVYVDPYGDCPESGFMDWLQGILDVGGSFEPTPFCDIVNSLISVGRGNYLEAGLTICGVIPYVGDTAKVGKYGMKGAKAFGRAGKQAKLRELAEDTSVSSADRGWIKQDLNLIERGKRDTIRVPPGKHLAHERGREAAKGFDYQRSNLQDQDLHRLQHKYDDWGRRNSVRE